MKSTLKTDYFCDLFTFFLIGWVVLTNFVAEYFMNADPIEVAFLSIKNYLQKHVGFTSLSANSEIPGKTGRWGRGVEKMSS